jgi:8-oxo-dGTP pyrophosphatase MutT (NUDIX family)
MSKATMVLEKLKEKMDSAGCLIIRNAKVLLVQRSVESNHYPLYWGIPAGRMNMGETPYRAAIRECYEETGIDLSRLRYDEAIKTVNTEDGTFFTTFVFCVQATQLFNVEIDYESEDWGWFTQNELKDTKKIDVHPGLLNVLDRVVL